MTRFIIATALLQLACSGVQDLDCTRIVPCHLPVMAQELDGKWCDARPAHLLCLEVYNGDSYAWLGSDCFEAGELFGGLEFVPYAKTVPSRCFGQGDLYSAGVRWTDTGLQLDIDGENGPLSLTYARQ